MTETASKPTSPAERLADAIAAGLAKADGAEAEATPTGTDAWYAVSYQPILDHFNTTRSMDLTSKQALERAWAQRKAMVSSWMRGIPKCDINHRAARRLHELETELGHLSLANTPEANTATGEPGFPLSELLTLANRVLNVSPKVRVVSSSKLLHFMLPGLAPIVDTNVSECLFNQSTPTVEDYLVYVQILRGYLLDGEHRDRLVEEAKKKELTTVRYVDRFLFRW